MKFNVLNLIPGPNLLGIFKWQNIWNLFYKVLKLIDRLTEYLLKKKNKVPSIGQFSGKTEILIMVSN